MLVFLDIFCGVIACRAEWGERDRLRFGAGSGSDLILGGSGSSLAGGTTSAADEELVLEVDVCLSEVMSSVALESVGIEESGDFFLVGRVVLLDFVVVGSLTGAGASDSLLDESSSETESDSSFFVAPSFVSLDSLDEVLLEEEVAAAIFEMVGFASSFAGFDDLSTAFTLVIFFSTATFAFLAGGTFSSSDDASDVDSEPEVSVELALRFGFETRPLAVGFEGTNLASAVSFSSSASLSELEDDADVDGDAALATFLPNFTLGAALFFGRRASLSSLSSLPLLLDVSSSFLCCLFTIFDFCDFDICLSSSSETPSLLLLALSSESLAS